MKQNFIVKHEKNDRLILVFAGWSTDDKFYSHIYRDGWDLMICSNYCNLIFDKSLLEGYSTIYLYAWSLGVFVANNVLQNVNITKAFAVNGTLNPVDDNKGIPVNIYHLTTSTLSERNLQKFRLRMFGGRELMSKADSRLPENDDINELQQQLKFIETASLKNNQRNINWNRIYISNEDRIFPSQNMLKAWETHNDIVTLPDAPHFVDIADIVRHTIPDVRRNAERFQKSLATYDENATAQRLIAERLALFIASKKIHSIKKCLEIGPGSGVFTHKLKDILNPHVVTFLELYDVKPFNIAPIEHYIIGDAESYIAKNADGIDEFDAVVSASAIQWFVNLPAFFDNVLKILAPKGMLACSLFLPGNLHELDSARAPMVYPSKEDLRKWLDEFSEVNMYDEEITLTFDSARDAILHISRTGVGGVASNNTLSQLTASLSPDESGKYHLTFNPVYIIATK